MHWAVWSQGANLVDKNDKVIINSPETVKALEYCKALSETFVAGTALGYFLERWGTTRECWTYYTRELPPVFAVLAHGMAAVAFWRTGLLVQRVQSSLARWLFAKRPVPPMTDASSAD